MAKLLLGKYFGITHPKGHFWRITETEAYAGVTDRGSHAFAGRRTARNEAMYASPGPFTYRIMVSTIC